MRSDLKIGDLRGATLEKARKDLNQVGKFKRPDTKAWNELGLFFKIRNVIVHAGGFTLGSNYHKAIEQFCEKRTDIKLEHGSIEIQPAFLNLLIEQLRAFNEQLEGEFKSLCEQTRSQNITSRR
jgi:hypothetical protein